MAVVIDSQRRWIRPPVRSQRCRLQSLTHFDFSTRLHAPPCPTPSASTAAAFHRSFSTPCLSTAADNTTAPLVQIVTGRPAVGALVAEVAIAMASGMDPVPITAGLGGAYLLQTRSGRNLAVIKPADEEPLALNNPKGFAGRLMGQPGLRRSVRVGETGLRELASFLLDHGRFAGVPPTTLVRIRHPSFHFNDRPVAGTPVPAKIASLQRYVDHASDAGDLGPSIFSVTSVHRIAILDVRLMNLDRHAGNMLVRRHDRLCRGVDQPVELVPIDHGLCLPEWLDDPYFEWLHWPQAAVPFSGAESEYISKLDPLKDAELLRMALPSLPEACIRVMVVCTILLKQAVSAGLCPAHIGRMMTRESCSGEEAPSMLESICAAAKAAAVSDGEGDQDSEMVFRFENGEDGERGGGGTRRRKKKKAVQPLFCRKREEGEQELEGRCLMKSLSFAGPSHGQETGGVGFGEMSILEWEMFLEEVEEMLPQALLSQGREVVAVKQRLGTSL